MAERKDTKPIEEGAKKGDDKRDDRIDEVEAAKKKLEGFGKAVEKAVGPIEQFTKAIIDATKSVKDFTIALDQLISAAKKGLVKSEEEVIKALRDTESRVRASIGEEREKILNLSRQIERLKESGSERDMKRAEELARERDRLEIEVFELQEAMDKRITELAEAMTPLRARIGAGGKIRTYHPKTIEEDRRLFQATLERLEAQDLMFSENWQDTYTLKAYIFSIPPERPDLIKEFQQEYEDRRRFHDFMWIYRKGGMGDLLNASNYCKFGVLERMKGRMFGGKYATEYLKWYQDKAEEILNQREKVLNLEEKRRTASFQEKERIEREIHECEEVERKILDEMKARLNGKEIERRVVNGEERLIIRDLEDGAGYRIGGELFSALGLAAQYGIVLNGVGDFMIGRLFNMERFLERLGSPGGLAEGKETLWKYWNQEAFVGPLFSSSGMNPEVDRETLKNLKDNGGIGERTIKVRLGGKVTERKIQCIQNFEKFRKISFLQYHVDEGTYGANYLDQLSKADDARSFLLSGDGYFRRANMEAFLELGTRLEHLKNERDRTPFAEGLLRGLIEFYDGRHLPRLEEWVIEKDKDGNPTKKTWRWVRSEAQKVYNDPRMVWTGDIIERNIDRAVPMMISAQKAELLKRKYLALFGIEFAWARDLRSFIETVGPRFPPALLAVILGGLKELIVSALPEELGIKPTGGRK